VRRFQYHPKLPHPGVVSKSVALSFTCTLVSIEVALLLDDQSRVTAAQLFVLCFQRYCWQLLFSSVWKVGNLLVNCGVFAAFSL
jgi:hypothetical protein